MQSDTDLQQRLGEGSGWTLHDDDLGMIPDYPSLGSAFVTRGTNQEDFPVLGGGSSTMQSNAAIHNGNVTGRWVATPWGRSAPAATRDFPSLPSQNPSEERRTDTEQRDAEEADVSRSQSASSSWLVLGVPRAPTERLTVGRSGGGSSSTSSLATDNTVSEAERRRKQLAYAFGINEKEHASMFASSNAEAFSEEHLNFARKIPSFVHRLEQQLEDFVVHSTSRRISLEIMPRQQREIVHVTCKHYGLTTQSYGSEPRRHVDIFRTQNTCMPSVRLSDAAKAPVAYLATTTPTNTYELRFSEVVDPYEIISALRNWADDFQVEWRQPEDLSSVRQKAKHSLLSGVATFKELRPFREAAAALGAGTRGRFLVSSYGDNEVQKEAKRASSSTSATEWTAAHGKSQVLDGDTSKSRLVDEWGDEITSPQVRQSIGNGEGSSALQGVLIPTDSIDDWEDIEDAKITRVKNVATSVSSSDPLDGTRYANSANVWDVLNQDE